MFRTTFDVQFSLSEASANCKAATQQTSPGVSLFCGEGRPYLANAPLGQRLCLCPVSHEGPHSHLSASGGVLSGGLKPLATHPNTAVPPGHDASAFYPPLFRGLPVRPELTTLTSAGPRLPFDPAMAAHPYGLLYAGLDVNGLGMRKAATRETTGPLKAWLHEHRKNPYPTKAEKIMLAIITKMTLTQVSTWFANARRRLKKESRLYTVKDGAHDDSDHNPRDRDDDDDANETDDDCGLLRGCTDSDEDINVDVSDISDHEDDPVTPTATSASTSSPMGKHSPLSSSPMGKHSPLSSSSPHTSFTSSPPFVANRIPFFLYTSGISPAMALHGVPNGVAHGNGCSTQATFSKTLSPAVIAQPSIPLGAAATAPSTAAARSSSSVVQSSRPKIWSISEIIHSESERTSATGSAAKVSESDRKNDRTKDDDVSRDTLHLAAAPGSRSTAEQNEESSGHDLSAMTPEAEGRQATCTRLLPLLPRQRGRATGWMTSPVAKKPRTTSSDVSLSSDNDLPPRVTSGLYPASSTEVSPQTEALDLQTKKTTNDVKPGT